MGKEREYGEEEEEEEEGMDPLVKPEDDDVFGGRMTVSFGGRMATF
jgi:hypothetical protein